MRRSKNSEVSWLSLFPGNILDHVCHVIVLYEATEAISMTIYNSLNSRATYPFDSYHVLLNILYLLRKNPKINYHAKQVFLFAE